MFADVPNVIVRSEGLVKEIGHYLDFLIDWERNVIDSRSDFYEFGPKIRFLIEVFLLLLNVRFYIFDGRFGRFCKGTNGWRKL